MELETQNEEMRANFEILQEKQVHSDPFASTTKGSAHPHHKGSSSDYGQGQTLEDEFNAGFNEKCPERIPNEFVWNYTEDDDDSDQRVQMNQVHRIDDSPIDRNVDFQKLDRLLKTMEEMNGAQKQQFESVSNKLSKIRHDTRSTMTDTKESQKMTLHEISTLKTMLSKVHSEQSSFRQNVQKSINDSFVSRSASCGNLENVSLGDSNAKIDALTNYLKTMKLDQRIITVYKKIDTKIESLRNDNHNANKIESIHHIGTSEEHRKQIEQILDKQSKISRELNQIQMDLHAIQYKQETQKEGIDNALEVFRELFEQQLTQILNQMVQISESTANHNHHENSTRRRSISPPLFVNSNKTENEVDSKTLQKSLQLSPITKTQPSNHNDSFTADSFLNAINGIRPIKHSVNGQQPSMQRYGEMVEAQSARVEEMMMSEFVMVLTNQLAVASESTFDKVFVMMVQITFSLYLVLWEGLKSLFTANPINVGGRLELILMDLKEEIDGVFRSIFQEAVNNVVKDLIDDKMKRIKLQSRISKLTNKLNQQKQLNLTLSKSQSKRLKQQIQQMSLHNLYIPITVAVSVVFLLGMFCGFCFSSSATSRDSSSLNQFI